MIKLTKQYFNMIEIALAIAIIAFGMSSILVLFPVGLNASRDSMADNYSADAIEQFVSYIQADVNKNTDTTPTDGEPDEYVNYFIDSASGDFISETQPSENNINSDSTAFMNRVKASATITEVTLGWGIYQASHVDHGGSSNQIYFLLHRSNASSVTNPKYDFMGAMAIWKSPVSSRIYTSMGTPGAQDFNPDPDGTANVYDKFAAINIELSWPLNKPYADRQKRYYYYVIKKP